MEVVVRFLHKSTTAHMLLNAFLCLSPKINRLIMMPDRVYYRIPMIEVLIYWNICS